MTERTTSAAEPLYEIIRAVRSPASLRELMAACLRSAYIGDPHAEAIKRILPPASLVAAVSSLEVTVFNTRCVCYFPSKNSGHPLPLIMYFHGGGFVFGCSEDTDYATRTLALENQCVVLSVNYPLAPELPFPGALEVCAKLAAWTKEADFARLLKAHQVSIHKDQLLLAGDSAGGNLALSLAKLLDDNGLRVAGAILLSPWLDLNAEAYDSFNSLAPTSDICDAAFIGYARGAYARYKDWNNPLASPIRLDPLLLPPCLLIAGDDDPLYDQSALFYKNAQSRGARHIRLQAYPGMPHCFYLFPNLFSEERDCYGRIRAFVSSLVCA